MNKILITSPVQCDDFFVNAPANSIFEIGIDTMLDGNISIPSGCVLRFTGGSINSLSPTTITGNNTRIDAGLYQIFGNNITLSGTWVVTTGYPEWWGAKASIHKDTLTPYDNKDAIQAALNSPIGHITFACGYYYIGSSLVLDRIKTISMQGRGQWMQHWGSNIDDNVFSWTVIWSDQNCNLLELLPITSGGNNGTITIRGGAFDVSNAGLNYNKSAILIYPGGLNAPLISSSLIGPMNIWGFNPESPNTIHIEDPKNNELYGNGIKITGHIANKSFHLATLDVIIRGFGTGLRIDYQENGNNYGDVTSLKLYGLINWCIRAIYAPSRAFNGGEISCDINVQDINRSSKILLQQDLVDTSAIPIIEGNMQEAYINPFIWDISYGDPMFKFTNTDHMRLGPRLLSVIDRSYSVLGQKSTHDPAVEYESLTQLATIRNTAIDQVLGILDPLQLGAYNAKVQASGYVHTIDNDFLSIDKVLPNASISITTEHIDGLNKLNKSPFDPCGMIVNFTNDRNNTEASLTFNASFAQGFDAIGKLQFMAIHLKGHGYIHFGNMKVTLTGTRKVNGVWEVYDVVFYDADYYNAVIPEKLRDIIIPILITGYDQDTNSDMNLQSLKVEFTNLVIEGMSPCWSGECFKMFIEGRLCKHFNQLVWTAGGGSLGNTITRNGKPYLLGTKQYSNFSSLPSNAAIGARGIVECSNSEQFPVVKTKNGWFVENLVGTSQELSSYNSIFGELTVGQQAFDTTLAKPVWWNGNTWIS